MKPGDGLQRLQQAQRDAQARASQQQAGWAWSQQKKQEHDNAEASRQAAARHAAFLQVESQAAGLQARHAAGQLDDAALKQALEKLMVQDGAGHWWMVGLNSGEWYRAEGDSWFRGQPPDLAMPAGAIYGSDTARSRGHPILAFLAFLILGTIFMFLGLAAGSFVAENIDNGIPAFIALFAVWGLGLLFSFSKARKIWRGPS
jgi:hypothetical protein